METDERIEHLLAGNRRYRESSDAALRERTAVHGQHPRTIVVACSDARVIPEEIFSAELGELFVIRVAGNVLDNHQLGSIEYAASHLGAKLLVVLGHTRCGAVDAAMHHDPEGFIRFITDEISLAIADEQDEEAACRLNALHSVKRIEESLEIRHQEEAGLRVCAALYHVDTGAVEFV